MTDSHVPVFDTAHFADVCGDDLDFQREIIGDFLSQFDSRLKDIAAAVAQRDPATIRLAAHALKGSAASLGARALAEATARLEDLGRNEALDEAPAALQQVLDQAGRLRGALATYRVEPAA